MPIFLRTLGLACIVTVGLLLSAHAENDIGTVDRARGLTTVSRGTQSQAIKSGNGIRHLDTLRTGQRSRFHVVFVDGTDLSLGDQSELVIDEMVFEPGKYGRGKLSLAQGVFRLVSGQVNKVSDGTLTITTPLATIGVRGTDFWGEQSADKLVMALLDDGELTITTKDGSVTLTKPLSAVVIYKGQPPEELFTLTPLQLKEAKAKVSW